MGPSAIDVEIRSMALDMGGSIELLDKFMDFLIHVFRSKKNFELASAYLALFLKVN
jgi:U3 small nucleolar RNA-associated protein 21